MSGTEMKRAIAQSGAALELGLIGSVLIIAMLAALVGPLPLAGVLVVFSIVAMIA